ncbi:NAD(P)H-binding protein [Amycolatopsis vancoresmycina]|uniref:Nucleotide-diphosphate-sugar epimerase/NmrA family protein n=1 Tax=Amycolatopsis vancoresmycina DSM 44592 TaxID=1292037 RepID=R1I9M4_9PSEU|nr:NAD(P)H-binding protein [Amycolatopsis vancoresmycina]EOD67084.1 nucleotide-diphosphate-sugar epimerase/NmrA family protein [Amycolatopsis vancoresmycina DSM 44592]
MTVLVTGATGHTGRHVVAGLKAVGVHTRALVRGETGDPDAVRGDIRDLAEAAEGVDAVYLLWPFFTADGIEEALEPLAGKKIVYLSAMSAEAEAEAGDGGVWGDVEAAVRKVTGDWTFLRVTGLATNALAWAPQAKTGVVRAAYGQAKRSVVHERDVADMAVKALTEDHKGQIYLVTGPEALAHAEQARLIGDALGTPVAWEEQPPEEAIEQLATYLGAEFAKAAVDHWASLVDDPEPVSLDVARVTGHPARPFDEWAREHFS